LIGLSYGTNDIARTPAMRRKGAFMHFASDNTAGAHPAVLAALAAANDGRAASYGADDWSLQLEERLSALFERRVAVFPVATGGAANALALSELSPPWGAVFCHAQAHINTDECGAPEMMTAGAKLIALDGVNGKLSPEALQDALGLTPRGVVHRVQPGAVSITQAGECGTVYRPAEIAALAQIAHGAGMKLHMDGARFANAAAFLGVSPAEFTWRAGVDVLSLGFTKTGAIAAEAVVFFDPGIAGAIAFRRKRSGHLFSKMRFMAAQFLAMLDGDLWLRLAAHANAMAAEAASRFAASGFPPEYPVEANEIFVRLPRARAEALRRAGASFYPWGPETGAHPLYRFVTSFVTEPAEIERLGYALSNHLA